jgi:hypothetical protein
LPARRLAFVNCRQCSISTGDLPADFLNAGDSLNELYLIVHAVDDLPPGHVPARASALELLKEATFAATLGISVKAETSGLQRQHLFLGGSTVRWNTSESRLPRRPAEASIIGGKLYLCGLRPALGRFC